MIIAKDKDTIVFDEDKEKDELTEVHAIDPSSIEREEFAKTVSDDSIKPDQAHKKLRHVNRQKVMERKFPLHYMTRTF